MRLLQRMHRVAFPLTLLAAALLTLPPAAASAAGGPPEDAPAHGQRDDAKPPANAPAHGQRDDTTEKPGGSVDRGKRGDDPEPPAHAPAHGQRDNDAKPPAHAPAHGQRDNDAKPPAHAPANGQRDDDTEPPAHAPAHGRDKDSASPEHAQGGAGASVGDGQAPAGNKGSVKVRTPGTAAHPPANEPHLACVVQVDFYGFPGPGATLTLRSHAPTAPVGETIASADVSFDSDGPNPKGNALVGRTVVDLSDALDGLTYHERQGYHVKLTAEADGPRGANTKHKVFWVDCPPPEEPPTEAEGVGGDGDADGRAEDDEEVEPDDTVVLGERMERLDTVVTGPGGAARERPQGAVLGAGGAAGAALGAGGAVQDADRSAVLGALGQLAQTGLGIPLLLGIALLTLAGGTAAVRRGRRG